MTAPIYGTSCVHCGALLLCGPADDNLCVTCVRTREAAGR